MTTALRRPALLLLVLLASAGCQYLPSSDGPRSRASAGDLVACRKRADEIYQAQNRGAVYDADLYRTSDRDSPYATSGLTGVTSDGLGARYQRDQFEDACLRSTNSSAPTQLNQGAGGGTASPAAAATRRPQAAQ
ncbi:MAG TPA: hypothetical protein VHS58_03105 [Acetobacteraceae bacterium]|jgi:hypothetical protein|nr:hypothetical protein [Acetobacteraceae bacterium]